MRLNISKSFSLFLQEKGSSLGEWPGGEKGGQRNCYWRGFGGGSVEKGAPGGGGGVYKEQGGRGGHAPLGRESISKCSSDIQHGIPSPPTAPAAQGGGVKTKINWLLPSSLVLLKPNSWTYNFVEVSGHNLERSQTRGFCTLHYKPVSNNFLCAGGGYTVSLVEVIVNSMEENSEDFCLGFV